MTQPATTAVLLAGFSVALTGCLNPALTRLPTLEPAVPQVEKRSFERFDPFPEPDLGPETRVRPPGFDNPRTEPRRALEERLFQEMSPGSPPAAPQAPRNSKYPGSVRY